MSREGGIDWGFGEIAAFGSLIMEGVPVRLAGQDSRRGTFVQRHAVFHDRANGNEWLPLGNLSDDQAKLWIYDSLLSEYAAMGFEYGYSVERPDAWSSGKLSSVTSSTVRKPLLTSSFPRPNRNGASAPRWCSCSRTATKARGRTTRLHASNASCRCAPRTT